VGRKSMVGNGETIIHERKGHIAVLTINRPEALNCLNREVCICLYEALDEIERDDKIRVAIITGCGEKAFCAGIDLKERKGMSDVEVNELRKRIIFPLFRKLESIEKPLIGAINGLALGGGAEIALLCDIRIASESARFGQTEVKWAIIPAAGACQRLPRIVGVGIAKELLLTGRIVDAQEGKAIGLFNKVTTPSALMKEAEKTAELIAENGPVAVRQIKKAINLGNEDRLAIAFDHEASEVCYHTQDRLEGILAFNEKRKPKYTGR